MHFETMNEVAALAKFTNFREQKDGEEDNSYKLELAIHVQEEGRFVEAAELRAAAGDMSGLSFQEVRELDPLTALKMMEPNFNPYE